jgi:HEAT repeat protein
MKRVLCWLGAAVIVLAAAVLWPAPPEREGVTPRPAPPSSGAALPAAEASSPSPPPPLAAAAIPDVEPPADVAPERLSPGESSAPPEDWQRSPRLWEFSREDAAELYALFDALQEAVQEGRRQEMQALIDQIEEMGERAVGPLLEILQRDPDDEVRVYAAALLGGVQDHIEPGPLGEALRVYALPWLEDLALDAEAPPLRHSALVALGKIGDPISLDVLAEALRQSQGEPFLAEAARQALSRMRGTEATGALIDLARSEGDPWMRAQLVLALDAREDPGTLDDLSHLARGDMEREVRMAAVRGIGALAMPDGDRVLASILRSPEEPGVRASAADALGRPGAAGNLALLRKLLRGPADAKVRSAAYRSIERIGTPEARDILADYRPAAVVDAVLPGGQAASLGLRPNDVVTAYAGATVTGSWQLRQRTRATPPTRLVLLKVLRGRATMTYAVRGGFLGVAVEDGFVPD